MTFDHRFDNNFWMVWKFWTQPKCFRKYTFRAWIWTQILYIFDWNRESSYPFNMSHRITQNMNSNYVPMEGRKNRSLMISTRFWHRNIFPISRDQSSRKKFCAKNTLVASYSRAVITLKMCWKVIFSHRFGNNFRTAWNFWTSLECFRKYTFRAWIWIEILHYFGGNQECYCPLNMSYWVTRKMDSNYVLMEEHKNGSLTIHSWIRLGNILPISRDQSSRKKILCKKYGSG